MLQETTGILCKSGFESLDSTDQFTICQSEQRRSSVLFSAEQTD